MRIPYPAYKKEQTKKILALHVLYIYLRDSSRVQVHTCTVKQNEARFVSEPATY